MATYTKTWHWNCASSLCTNNYRTKGITYYTLPSDPELQKGYRKVLMNENINWRKHVICSAHWSSGKRENKNQLPDITCTKEYAANLEKEYSQKPSRELKRKIDCTKTVLTSSNANTVRSTPRKPPKDRSETPVPRVKKRRVSAANVEKENQKLKSQVESLRRELNGKTALIEDLQQQLSKTQTELEKNAANNTQQLNAMKKALEGQTFSYEALMRYPDRIYYMTGLTLSELDCLYECLEPFLHTIVYPDCNNDDSSHLRKLDTKTELISFLTICRHALDLGVIAWMTGSSISTMSRIFVGWCVFLSTIFESIDLTPLPGFLNDYMPKCFMESGYGDTALIGDATEIWISQSENFDINNITFSNYKNHTTGKICLWTLPPGFLLKCTDAFPGSISDADITEQSCVLDTVTKGKTVMTDKGFNITDICHLKGLLHNRPPMKFSHQFDETEVVKNFDIATLRIYIENYIGRIRDWQILSKTWPSSRIDLLGCCFQIFAHIVNMLKKPVGPK